MHVDSKGTMPRGVLSLSLSILSACSVPPRENSVTRTGWEPIRTPGNVTIEFVREGAGDYEIRWSRGPLHRSTSQRIAPTGGGEPAYLWWESKQFVVLRQGCGSPCWIAVVLPLDARQEDRLYWYPVAYDRDRNLLAYLGEDVRSVVAENLVTHRTQVMPVTPLCSWAFPGWCVSNVEFRADTMHVRWCSGEVYKGVCSDFRESDIPLAEIVNDRRAFDRNASPADPGDGHLARPQVR
jgi:hypothetical protein